LLQNGSHRLLIARGVCRIVPGDELLQAGGAKAPAEPWTTMPNIGAW
jgi:hypothetical protein